MAGPSSTCRWAALSLSSIAIVFLGDLLLARGDDDRIHHSLVSVSTTGTKERAEKWFVDNKIARPTDLKLYHSWEMMLEEGDFDIVYISTPHSLHFQHVKKALECRRHVLVEKPATMNRAQYAELVAMAKRQGVVMMEAMWTRYLPATRHFKDDVLPRIGEVRRVFADFSFPIVSPDLSHESRFLDKMAGAGSLLDQGVYALTWADLALNGLEESSAHTTMIHANSMAIPGVKGEVDDINTVILSKRDREDKQIAVGIATTSMTIAGSSKPSFYTRLQAKKPSPSIRIEATNATVCIAFPPIRPQELHIQWYDEAHLDANGVETEEIVRKPVERGWGIWYQADVIADKVVGRARASRGQGQGEIIGEQQSLRILGWMDEVRASTGIVYDPKMEALI